MLEPDARPAWRAIPGLAVSGGTTSATSDRAEHVEPVLSGHADPAAPGARPGIRLLWVEAALAIATFAVLCAVVLAVASQPAEPDDGA